MWCVKHFHPYLYGRKFRIVTDHRPLVWLINHKNPHSRLMRWRISLEEYDYEISYKKGKLNTNADALSRNPIFVFRRMNADTLLDSASEEEEESEKYSSNKKRRKNILDPSSRKRVRTREDDPTNSNEEPITLVGKRKRNSIEIDSEQNKKQRTLETECRKSSKQNNQPEDHHQEDHHQEDHHQEDHHQDVGEKEENKKEEIIKLGKQLYLTNSAIPEGSVDVSFVRDNGEQTIEIYHEEDHEEYHIIVEANSHTSKDELKEIIKELMYLAVAEEFKELYIDHNECARSTGFSKREIEKIWKDVFCRGITTIFLHDRERIVPKKEDIEKILKKYHDSLLGGHGGVKKTYY